MPDNIGTVQSLQLDHIHISRTQGVITARTDIQLDIIINEHLSTFPKTIVPTLPANLQADVEHLFADLEEFIKQGHFDLDL